jgi:hypothetical protein
MKHLINEENCSTIARELSARPKELGEGDSRSAEHL